MEFKSQVHTTLEQSKRLVALGLKKETADCCHYYVAGVTDEEIPKNANYPAWSLHRLIELLDGNIAIDDFAIEWAYDTVIDHIAFDIRHDQFNYEYLEERKCEK